MKNWLGAKTHFSATESIVDPEKLIKAAKKAGYEGIVVTDSASIDSMPIMMAKADGMKVGLAVQVAVVDDLTWRAAKRGEPKRAPNPMFMPTLFAKDQLGFEQLCQLLTLANDADHYSTKPARPQLTLDEVLEVVKLGSLSMTLGSAYSVFSLRDVDDKLARITSALSAAQTLAELVPVNSAYYDQHNVRAMEAIDKYGLTPIITRPTLNQKGEVQFRNAMNCIMDHAKLSDGWRREPPEDLHLLEPAELDAEIEAAADRVEALKPRTPAHARVMFDTGKANADAYFTAHPYSWAKMPVTLPTMSADPMRDVVDLCKQGWVKRLGRPVFGYKPDAAQLPEYRERLKYELSVLSKMKFESYFLLVNYIVSWSKDNGILVGPGRGSVGGSLVAYLMGITDVDPIRFNLIFERFINPERIDLPDIDLDFMSSRRQDIVDQLVSHFGSDNVTQMANYNTLAGAGAIQAVGKVYGLPEHDYECSKLVPKESGVAVPLEQAVAYVPELERLALLHPDAWKTAVGLQGAFRNFAKHAAAVIVTGEPVSKRGVVVKHDESVGVVNWDKRVCEDFGLVKLDVLGLSNLDILRLCQDYIRESTGTQVDFTQLPLDDKDVLNAFAEGRTYGIFQFDGGGMKKLLRELGSTGNLTFEDVVAATALFRPGPIQAGLMDLYVRIKKGFEEPDYPHPNMVSALEPTMSVMVYQEQVMQISRDLAGYTMADADVLRKIMGKKDPVKMAEQRDKFVDGCMAKSGLNAHTATHIFDQIDKFAGYAFNKSHSVAYTLISYMTMWVKVHHPEAFFAACLSVLGDDKLAGIAKDAVAHDIYIVPPDINHSSRRFEVGFDKARSQKILYAPFQSVKGIAEKGADAIVEARRRVGGKFKDRAHMIANVDRRAVNKRHQESLDLVGAFHSVEPGSQDARHPDRLRNQKVLLPGIVVNNVKADRVIIMDPHVVSELTKIIDEVQDCKACPFAGKPHPVPAYGKKPKMMIVLDSPSWKEEEKGSMLVGDTGEFIKQAMKASGLRTSDIYVTSLLKARKAKNEELENSTLIGCSRFLEQEIALLKPPVIVALGGKAIRHLVPDVKGGYEELCGKSHYNAALDCTVVMGINPAMICFDDSKQAMLDAVFAQVAEIFT